MNGDPEHGAQEPFFIGEAAALYDTKAGEVGITYTWELGDQETLFSKMCNNDAVLDIIKYDSSVSYTCVPYLQLSTRRLRTAMMQVSKDTPDKLATLTKPLEPVQLKLQSVCRRSSSRRRSVLRGRMQWPVEDLGPAQT